MFFGIFIFFFCFGWSQQYQWTYTSQWEGTCRKGRKQSPINLESTDTWSYYPPIKFNDAAFQPVDDDLRVINNGHSLKVYGPAIERVRVSGGALGAEYNALQLHFHWGSHDAEGSEHTLKGKAYPLEMHLVTTRFKDAKEAIASGEPDALAVLGVFFQRRGTDKRSSSRKLMALKQSLLEAATTVNKEIRPTGLSLTVRDLFPDNLVRFYRYEGSLTTPPCAEIVKWTVFEEPKIIEGSALDEIRKARGNDGTQLLRNYRKTQAYNGRKVFFNSATRIKSHLKAL